MERHTTRSLLRFRRRIKRCSWNNIWYAIRFDCPVQLLELDGPAGSTSTTVFHAAYYYYDRFIHSVSFFSLFVQVGTNHSCFYDPTDSGRCTMTLDNRTMVRQACHPHLPQLSHSRDFCVDIDICRHSGCDDAGDSHGGLHLHLRSGSTRRVRANQLCSCLLTTIQTQDRSVEPLSSDADAYQGDAYSAPPSLGPAEWRYLASYEASVQITGGKLPMEPLGAYERAFLSQRLSG